jgi:hypothetical protein
MRHGNASNLGQNYGQARDWPHERADRLRIGVFKVAFGPRAPVGKA